MDNSGDKIGIDRVDYYSSTEGVLVFKGHQYELISVYNNTSGENQDAMAVMFLYILDRDYTKPALTRGKS